MGCLCLVQLVLQGGQLRGVGPGGALCSLNVRAVKVHDRLHLFVGRLGKGLSYVVSGHVAVLLSFFVALRFFYVVPFRPGLIVLRHSGPIFCMQKPRPVVGALAFPTYSKTAPADAKGGSFYFTSFLPCLTGLIQAHDVSPASPVRVP